MNNRHKCIIALILISICTSLSSVNSSEIPCTDLQKYAAEKGSPIVYEEETNEYHIKYKQENGGESSIIIRYCPSCGAEAPKSIRESLFCKVSEAEDKRLNALFGKFKSLEKVKEKFGEPDSWSKSGISISIFNATEKPQSKEFKVAIFSKVSEVADVWIELNNDNTIHGIMIIPKEKKK